VAPLERLYLPHVRTVHYYQWQETADSKQPWYFTARDGSPVLTIEGLWDEWKNRETGPGDG
jgi:putative SOS response-associated peptidase YedK